MDNIYEYLKRKTENNQSGFETDDFSLLGFDHVPSDNEIEFISQSIINGIKNIEDKNVLSCGYGANKQAFTTPILPNKVILKSTDYMVHKPSKEFYNGLALKKFGVNVAFPQLRLNSSEIFTNGDSNTWYEVQDEAKGSFVSAFRGRSLSQLIITNNPNLKYNLLKYTSGKNFIDQYNLAMVKHRAKTGLPHLKKFYFDSNVLNAVKNFDMHTENIFYSSKDGYTFFDLSCDLLNSFSRLFSNSNDLIYSMLKNNRSEYKEESHFQTFLTKLYGIELPSFTNPLKSDPSFGFTLNVYNGVLFYQFLQAFKNGSPENELYNTYLPNTSKFLHDETLKLENGLSELFALAPSKLLKLEKALTLNEQSGLNEIKDEFDLPADFDFACIDIPNFLETMQQTHKFDFSNPNPAQLNQTQTREHIEVNETDGELGFGLV